MPTIPFAQKTSLPKTLALMFGLLVMIVSCDEELPLYKEPETLLTISVDGEYWLSDTEHSFRANIHVTNAYEETLEGPASLSGAITIVAARDPSVRKTLLLKSQHLIRGATYLPGGILRIDSKATMTLQAVWSFPGDSVFIDDGRDLAHNPSGGEPFFSFVKDTTCDRRRLARPEDLLIEATLTVFSKKAPISTDIVAFPLCFISNWVSTKLCPHIATMPPCGYWRR